MDDSKMLAEELLWSFKNQDHRNDAVLNNRRFVEENANYSTNMKIIADKYHELISTFETP
jgi:hypothetical protein